MGVPTVRRGHGDLRGAALVEGHVHDTLFAVGLMRNRHRPDQNDLRDYSEPLGSNFSFKHAGGPSPHNHQLVAARISYFNVTLSTEPADKRLYSVC